MFDYLIQNGTLIDGTGAPAAAGDVAIKDGKIAAVGDLKDASAGTVLDAAGKYVTPGFIDIHRHADAALFRPHFGELELKQGLTDRKRQLRPVRHALRRCIQKRDRGISDPGCGRAAGERRFFQPRFLSVRCKKDPQPHQHRHAGGQRHHPRLRGRLRHARA